MPTGNSRTAQATVSERKPTRGFLMAERTLFNRYLSPNQRLAGYSSGHYSSALSPIHSFWVPTVYAAGLRTRARIAFGRDAFRPLCIALFQSTGADADIDEAIGMSYYQAVLVPDQAAMTALPDLKPCPSRPDEAFLKTEDRTPRSYLPQQLSVNFQRAFAFTGKAAENNRYLSKYYKENPTEANPFKLVQYRQGIHWYDISPEMDTKMRNFTSEEYIHLLNDRKEKALSSLLAHEKYHPNSTSNDFKKYIEAEIIYDWAYHILAHGHIYEKIKSIERSYFDLLSNVSLTNDQIGNFRYRQYLKAYMDKMYMFDAVKADNPYLGIYRLSESRLSGQSKEFVQSEMICTGFSKKYISELIPVYEEFLHGCSNSYSEKVAITFEEAMQNAVGSAASNFVIRNSQAEEVTLNSLKGKTIYLNFWASWCQPCVRKMLELKDLEGELKNSNVEFVHISFDRDESTWASTIRSFNFKGIHALATDGVNSELAKAYGVRAIPQYFIINKEGKFAPKPTTHSVDELKKILVSLDSK